MSEGRLPQSVYWRRRMVVLGIPVLLVVLVVWLLTGRGAAEEPPSMAKPVTTAATTKAPKPKPTSKPTTTPTTGVADCRSLDVGVTADAKSYAAGQPVKLATSITNTGKDACLVDAGSDDVVLLVTSGDDQVWSSQDCAASSAKSKPLLLGPGEKTAVTVTWKRVRSEPGCPKGLPAPKNGTYTATYSVADQDAAPAVFALK